MVMSAAAEKPPEAVDLTVKIALYDDKLSTRPALLSLTWEKFADFIVNYPEESPCTLAEGPLRCKGKNCPHKAFSSIKDNPMAWSPTDIEGARLDSNVRAITLLSLDFDHLELESAQQAIAKLATYEHVRHTTHSHREDDICFRAILAISRPVLANEFHRFLASAVAYLDVTVTSKDGKKQQPDRTCSNRSRLYFRPSAPKGAPRDAGLVRGRILDVDEVLAWGATQPQILPAFDGDATELPEEKSWDLESETIEDAIDLAQRFFPASQRNEFCLALGGMLRRAGAAREDARYIVREICVQGGSNDPDARARTVDHTYDRDDDSAMTGFTRVAEIVGEDVARELGDFLTDARNEAILRNTPVLGTAATGTSTALTTTTGTAATPAAPVDLAALRKEVSALASKRMRSLERDDKITGILLRRMLNGEPLAQPGGIGDPETVRSGDDNGIGREAALRTVTGLLAFTLDPSTPWDAVAEILRPSLSITAAEPGQNWLSTAQKFYKRSLTTRQVKEAERKAEIATYQERVRQTALAAVKPEDVPGGGGGSGMPPDGPNWQDQIQKGTNGAFAQTPYNVWVMFRNHPDFCGFIKWNEISKQVIITGGVLLYASGFGIEAIITKAQDILSNAHGIHISNRKDIAYRLMTVARENAFDPLKDYLNSIVWDGVPRISNWLKTYCGATEESDEYLTRVSRCWLISLVARGLTPGCKVDNVLVLQGVGGLGKSTVFSIFGGEWFCDTAISLGDKDSRMMAGQYWLCEMAEIVAFKKTGHDTLKSFFSSSVDRFRPPYAAAFEESPRRCVWVGTTNDDDFLVDETGNRKYWPVICKYIEGAMALLKQNRDQLLAEAVVAFKAGEKWHFDYKDIAITEIETERHMVETPTKSLVASWWYGMTKSERPRSMTTAEVAMNAFDCNPSQLISDRGLLKSIGMTMSKMGFQRRRDTQGARVWRLYPTEELLNAERVEVKRGNLFVIPGGKKDDDRK
jgi:hypothetical protein